MHVPDGMLPLPVTLAGHAASAALVGFCIYKIKQRGDPRDDIPKAALLAAAFFSASLIQIPIPPASVHLVLGGLLGAVLGAFVFRLYAKTPHPNKTRTALFGFTAGAGATALSVAIFTLFLFYTIPAHLDASLECSAIITLGLLHIPVIVVEGFVTAFIVLYLQKAKPHLLGSM